MLRFKTIELSSEYNHGYDPGAIPGIKCKVTFQVGDKSYDTIDVKLLPDAVQRVVAAAVQEALNMMTCDLNAIDVDGKAGIPKEPENEAIAEIATPEPIL
jgi:hypothetical protein